MYFNGIWKGAKVKRSQERLELMMAMRSWSDAPRLGARASIDILADIVFLLQLRVAELEKRLEAKPESNED